MEPHVVILAHGDFPSSEACLKVLRSADVRICCDGSTTDLLDAGLQPDYIVGDMDSLDKGLQEEYAARIRRFAGQDDNDMTKAFHFALGFNPSKISILGATGAREDHTLGNISLLLDYASESPCPVEMLTDYGRFAAIGDSTTLPSVPGQEISIFCFDHSVQIIAEGLEYPTDKVVFDTLWKGTLNVASGDRFTLHLSHPCGVLVYFAEKR